MPTLSTASARPAAVAAALRSARLAVFTAFFACGLAMGVWLVSIPAVQAETGVPHAVLGGLLLLLGLGGVVGMQAAGALAQRFGSKPVTLGFLVLLALAVNLPLHVGTAVMLGVALLVFGVMNGAVDVAMNDQAVLVERAYGRPIMSAFHALWSVGGAVGALLGAAVQRAELPMSLAALLCTVVVLACAALAAKPLMGRAAEPSADGSGVQSSADGSGAQSSADGSGAEGASAPAGAAAGRDADEEGADGAVSEAPAPRPSTARADARRRVLAFGTLAFLLMLAEGVANDWAALHAVETLEAEPSTAALAYATFAVSMTVGRLTVDRVAGRFGPAFVVRYGSALAAAGLLVVMLSPAFWLTAAGWMLFGLGLAGVVPQLFTAAGAIDPARQSIIMSRVVGAGYVGQLAGPALVGAAAGLVGLNLAFLLPFAFCLLGVVVARTVTPPAGS